MRGLKIITAGPYTTVQDRGRPGRQWLGIPEGGVVDRDGFALANALCGNDAAHGEGKGAAVLEIWLGGFSAEALASMRVALTGTYAGVLCVRDKNASAEERIIPANRSADIKAGEVITLAAIPDSSVALLAFAGGIDAPLFYGSRSTSPSVGIGGFDGGILKSGATIPLGDARHGDAPPLIWQDAARITRRHAPHLIRVVPGPQDDAFTRSAREAFFATPYTATPVFDRMGMRLAGAGLTHRSKADIASDGIIFGSVQVPRDGQPIILLADHGSTGGYAKIATVISADIPRLVRLRERDALYFSAVSVGEAETLARLHHRALQNRIANLAPAPPLG